MLGAGTAVPVADHSPSGILVMVRGKPFLFDIGPGTISRLERVGVSYAGLDFLLLTHLHPDHSLDLAILFQDFNSTPGWQRTDPFTLVGCKGTREFVNRFFILYPNIVPEKYRLNILEVEKQGFSMGGVPFSCARTGHLPNSLAYRLEADHHSVVYSGDASENGELVGLADRADVLISECSFPSGWDTEDHLNADSLGRLAQQARVKSLVVTHMYPQSLAVDLVSQIRAHYSGPVQLATDGMRVEIG